MPSHPVIGKSRIPKIPPRDWSLPPGPDALTNAELGDSRTTPGPPLLNLPPRRATPPRVNPVQSVMPVAALPRTITPIQATMPGPVATPAPSPAPLPTFAPPAPNRQITDLTQRLGLPVSSTVSTAPNAQLQALIDEMKRSAESGRQDDITRRDELKRLSDPFTFDRPDTTARDQQALQLRNLIAAMGSAEGLTVPDISSDPEAIANRVRAERQGERSREAEAARLGASGMSGSGAFDSRLAQIREQTGENILGFEAGLSERRRAERQRGAISAATLGLADLDRQGRDESETLNRQFAVEQARRGGLISAAQLAGTQQSAGRSRDDQLLQALLAQEGGERADRSLLYQQQVSGQQNEQQLLAALLAQEGRGAELAYSDQARRDAAMTAERARTQDAERDERARVEALTIQQANRGQDLTLQEQARADQVAQQDQARQEDAAYRKAQFEMERQRFAQEELARELSLQAEEETLQERLRKRPAPGTRSRGGGITSPGYTAPPPAARTRLRGGTAIRGGVVSRG